MAEDNNYSTPIPVLDDDPSARLFLQRKRCLLSDDGNEALRKTGRSENIPAPSAASDPRLAIELLSGLVEQNTNKLAGTLSHLNGIDMTPAMLQLQSSLLQLSQQQQHGGTNGQLLSSLSSPLAMLSSLLLQVLPQEVNDNNGRVKRWHSNVENMLGHQQQNSSRLIDIMHVGKSWEDNKPSVASSPVQVPAIEATPLPTGLLTSFGKKYLVPTSNSSEAPGCNNITATTSKHDSEDGKLAGVSSSSSSSIRGCVEGEGAANEGSRSLFGFKTDSAVTTVAGRVYWRGDSDKVNATERRAFAIAMCFRTGPLQLWMLAGETLYLWQFLLQLLLENHLYATSYCHSHNSDRCSGDGAGCLVVKSQAPVEWTGIGWEFKIFDPETVARLWGMYKNFPRMNYAKLARGLRFYYNKGIIQKTPVSFAYRFSPDKVLSQPISGQHLRQCCADAKTSSDSDNRLVQALSQVDSQVTIGQLLHISTQMANPVSSTAYPDSDDGPIDLSAAGERRPTRLLLAICSSLRQ